MKRVFLFIGGWLCISGNVTSQELYPNSEPASIIPKNALGVRLMNEAYDNSGDIRGWNGTMFMYGLSSKVMLNAMITGSNHHGKALPEGFVTTDTGTGPAVYPSPSSQRHNYLFESVNLGFRYRFLNLDGDHKHFRMALYGNGVYSSRPHDEAEVTLMGDNKGVGGGIISTLLIKKLAISFTGGMIRPFSYKESSGLALHYHDAFNYSLSFGYLLFPFKYKNFKQTNVNLYAEFLGKSYEALSITENGKSVPHHNSEGFGRGNYIECRPAIQFIIRSNLRIDLATAIPLVNRSHIRQYPLYLLNLQYYFFL